MIRQGQQQVIRRETFAQPFSAGGATVEERVQRVEQALGENFRDAASAARGSLTTYLASMIAFYTEPMYLTLSAEPRGGIVLVRIRKYPDNEQPVVCGGMVHFVWEGTANRARITNIDGLTPSLTQQYEFNFQVVG